MIERTHTIEVHQDLTVDQASALARYSDQRPAGEPPYVLSGLGDDRAASVWAYACEEGLRATLVTQTRIDNFVEASA